MTFEFIVSRTVRDTAAMLDAVQGPMPGDPYGIAPPERPYADEVGADPGSLRVGVLSKRDDARSTPTAWRPPSLRGACSRRSVIASRRRIRRRWPARHCLLHTLAIISSGQARVVEDFGRILGRELGPDDMDCDNWAVTEMGRRVSAMQYLGALQAHHDYQRRVASWWEDGFDLLITPTIAAPPPRIGEMVPDPAKPMDAFMRSGGLLPFTLPFNVTGQPAVSLPLHWNAAGLPIGVQLDRGNGREDLLIRVARQLEQEVEWSKRRPQIHA